MALAFLLIASPTGIGVALAQSEITGSEGPPASHFYEGSYSGTPLISIIPTSTSVGNCIPFGNNTSYGFAGFIYRSVGAFSMKLGDKIRFDLGRQNDVDIRRNIYFAPANLNPDGTTCGFNTGSQGVAAVAWTQVVSETQIPANSKGNFITGDFELEYLAESAFNFAGGALIVGFQASPPAAFADTGCEQVLVYTSCSDASGNFYARFFGKPDLTLGVLDDLISGGSGVVIGGMVIESTTIPVDIDIKPGSDPNAVNPGAKGKIPVAILTTSTADGDPLDFDAWDVDPLSLAFGPDGAGIAHSNAHAEDVDGDGDLDMVVHFKTQETGIACGDTEATLTGETFGGLQIEGTDAIQTVGCTSGSVRGRILALGTAPSDPVADRAERKALRREARKQARLERRLERLR